MWEFLEVGHYIPNYLFTALNSLKKYKVYLSKKRRTLVPCHTATGASWVLIYLSWILQLLVPDRQHWLKTWIRGSAVWHREEEASC